MRTGPDVVTTDVADVNNLDKDERGALPGGVHRLVELESRGVGKPVRLSHDPPSFRLSLSLSLSLILSFSLSLFLFGLDGTANVFRPCSGRRFARISATNFVH